MITCWAIFGLQAFIQHMCSRVFHPTIAGCYPNMGRVYRVSAKSGKNQGNCLCLKCIREKSLNLGSAREIHGNIRENLCFCFFNQSIS